MAARTLTWYIRRSELTGSPAMSVRLDTDYEPQFAWAIAKIAPGAQAVMIDILSDSTTIFNDVTSVLQIPVAQTVVKAQGVKQSRLRDGQIVSLSVLQSDGAVGDITVGLELA